ncbi:VQ protein [Dillenia turbinata]|uniref:VQ protein n=1 Tax=Dillenia turbinata TaxID=194707 RepID=A0AAN8VYU3_9MAGN
MDKSCHSSAESTATASTTTSNSSSSNRDQYLRHLNRISHKISKPIRRPNSFDPHAQSHHHQPPPPPPQPHPQPQLQTQPGLTGQPQPPPQQHQPPVYNINKSDFRDVVQKLTGSPAHERFSTPPPINPPKPPSSRLQKIRPPPLAQITNRPPPLLNCAAPLPPPQQQPQQSPPNAASTNPIRLLSNPNPLSPLPPFPAVHAAAESPISAYMRYLQTTISAATDSDPKLFSGFSPLAPLVSPRWTNLSPLHQPSNLPHNHQIPVAPPQIPPPSQYPMPTSPLAFGCIPSPKSPYALLSPSLFLSPTAGQLGFQQFPLSPRFALPSPRWRDL